MSVLSELTGMRNREGLSLREQAALALALAMLDAEPQISLDVYHQMPSKVELLDGILVLSDFR